MIASKPARTEGFIVGKRVQLHPCTDTWMRGDRYGTIVKVTRKLVHTKLDKSGRTAKLHPSLIVEQF